MVHAHVPFESLDAQEAEIGGGLGIAPDTDHVASPHADVHAATGPAKAARAFDPFVHNNFVIGMGLSGERDVKSACRKRGRGQFNHFSSSEFHEGLR
jgi:hypothetical protein